MSKYGNYAKTIISLFHQNDTFLSISSKFRKLLNIQINYLHVFYVSDPSNIYNILLLEFKNKY